MSRPWKPQPLVSVVLPTYNRRRLLGAAVRSVLVQELADFELIVVDDGSTDGSHQLIRGIRDPRLVYVHQANRGEYAATNAGFRLARGRYITVMHSDDIMPQGSLARRVRALEGRPELDFCHGAIAFIDERGRPLSTLDAVDWSARKVFRQYLIPANRRPVPYMVHYPTIMFRRVFLEEVGYLDEGLPFAGDFDWMLRTLSHGKMVKATGILYLYRRHRKQRVFEDPKRIDVGRVLRKIVERYLSNRSRH